MMMYSVFHMVSISLSLGHRAVCSSAHWGNHCTASPLRDDQDVLCFLIKTLRRRTLSRAREMPLRHIFFIFASTLCTRACVFELLFAATQYAESARAIEHVSVESVRVCSPSALCRCRCCCCTIFLRRLAQRARCVWSPRVAHSTKQCGDQTQLNKRRPTDLDDEYVTVYIRT